MAGSSRNADAFASGWRFTSYFVTLHVVDRRNSIFFKLFGSEKFLLCETDQLKPADPWADIYFRKVYSDGCVSSTKSFQ